MGKLTHQIRGAIRDAIECGEVSQYSLAAKIGISEAMLSRFLSGKRGLQLATADKIADVLGLEVFVTVQRLPRQKKRGKKGEGDGMNVGFSWNRLALAQAEENHEENFPSRRGLYCIEGPNMPREEVMCLYNNNPYANHPSLRDEETTAFREGIEELGIKELAYATYPAPGAEGEGYTYAMILDARCHQGDAIADLMNRIVRESNARMKKGS